MGTATTGYEDLKNIAVGRLFLDNIPHVKTHWPMVTPFLSQIALSFGCDDVEGTVVYERIYHEAGAHTAMHMPYIELVRLIRGAGKRPVERDSLYQAVREQFDDPPPEPSLRRGLAPAGGARRMRLGRIPWINCYPVYGAIDRGMVHMPAELVTGTASELNDLLAAGELQVSVVSAVEYARNAARVSSAARPRHHLRRPGAQRRALLQAAGRRADRPYGARSARPPGPRCCCSSCSAAIGGDVRPRVRHGARGGDRTSTRSAGCRMRPCSSSAMPRSISPPRQRYPVRVDLGAEWKAWTGLPFVFAVWAARREAGLRPCRRCIAASSSHAPGDWRTSTSSRPRPPAHRRRGAGVPRVSRRSRLRAVLPAPRRV